MCVCFVYLHVGIGRAQAFADAVKDFLLPFRGQGLQLIEELCV